MTRFYLAGAMTGKDGFNYDEFHKWAERIRSSRAFERREELINPAENFDGDQGRPYKDYISLAVKQVTESDGVFLMPKWWESKRGVYVELVVALAMGIPVYELKEDPDSVLGWTSKQIPTTGDITIRALADMRFTTFQCTLDGEPQPSGYEEQMAEAVLGSPLGPEGQTLGDHLSFEERLEEGYASAKEFGEKNRAYLADGLVTYEEAREAEGLEPEEPERITDEAWGLVMGDREAAYGHPASDFKAMGRITGAILSRWLESVGLALVPKEILQEWPEEPVHFPDIDPRIVALIMTAVKISRLSAQHKHDSTADLIGYAICEDRIAEGY
jgi:hypothetical protein